MDESVFFFIVFLIITPAFMTYCVIQNNKDRETQIKIEQIRKGDCND